MDEILSLVGWTDLSIGFRPEGEQETNSLVLKNFDEEVLRLKRAGEFQSNTSSTKLPSHEEPLEEIRIMKISDPFLALEISGAHDKVEERKSFKRSKVKLSKL